MQVRGLSLYAFNIPLPSVVSLQQSSLKTESSVRGPNDDLLLQVVVSPALSHQATSSHLPAGEEKTPFFYHITTNRFKCLFYSLEHTSLKVRRHQRHEMITNSSMSNNWHEATINSTSLPPSGYISCYIWSVLSIILADHISTKNKQFLFLPTHSTQDHRSGYMSSSGFASWYRLLAGYSFSEVATFYVLLLSLPSLCLPILCRCVHACYFF